jgi:predicted RNA-binding protein with PUA-like domain
MQAGDRAFLYHSMSDKAVVGIMEIARTARPDAKAQEGERWVSVAVTPVEPLPRPVTLAEIKAEPRLKDMELIRQSRLSVAPIREEEWAIILELARSER